MKHYFMYNDGICLIKLYILLAMYQLSLWGLAIFCVHFGALDYSSNVVILFYSFAFGS